MLRRIGQGLGSTKHSQHTTQVAVAEEKHFRVQLGQQPQRQQDKPAVRHRPVADQALIRGM